MTKENSTHRKWLIGITDYITPPADIEKQAFPEGKFIFLPDWRASEENKKMWRQVDAILVWHWHVDLETTKLLDKCKIVVRYGVGYDAIDLKALAENKIPLCNTPDYGTEEVADTACAMIMMIIRKLLPYDRSSRGFKETWQENLIKPHHRTSDQTLGIIGVGRIGTAVVNRMKPFGMKIIGYDPYQPSGHEKAIGYKRVDSLSELLEKSDIISIHCPLNNKTRGMVNNDFIEAMKKGGAIVNTARGRIIKDLDCLEKGLKQGKLSTVALDVLPDEPPSEHSLIQAWRSDEQSLSGQILINPHTAYYSERGWYEMRFKAAETARLFLLENRLRNHIIP